MEFASVFSLIAGSVLLFFGIKWWRECWIVVRGPAPERYFGYSSKKEEEKAKWKLIIWKFSKSMFFICLGFWLLLWVVYVGPYYYSLSQ